jgi:formiminotetrahydrofolate cyclodeaminase
MRAKSNILAKKRSRAPRLPPKLRQLTVPSFPKAANAPALMDVSLREFIRQLSEGPATPGCGNVAAFNAMQSAAMLKVVAAHILAKSSKENARATAARITSSLNTLQFPQVETIMEKDGPAFGLVVELRKLRNTAPNLELEQRYEQSGLIAQRPATDLQMTLADICLDLAEFSVQLAPFSPRWLGGDMSAALNNAVCGGDQP